MTVKQFFEELTETLHLEIREAPGNRPFAVEDPNKIWLVVSGTLELFLVPLRDGAPYGLGYHLLQVATNGALFGIGLTPGFRVQARGGVATQLVEVSRNQLSQLAAGHPEAFAQLLELWVLAVQTALAPSQVPSVCRTVYAGKQVAVAAQTQIAVSARCLWIRSRPAGLSLFNLDQQDLVALSSPFPLSRPAWLGVSQAGEIDVLTTLEVCQSEQVWPGLDSLHAQARRRAVEAFQGRQLLEDQRILEKASVNRLALAGAANRMASVIPDSHRVIVEASGSLDPLLAACQVVGRALNVTTIRRPLHRSRASGDDIHEIAHASRVRVRSVTLSGRWWKTDSGPMLGFLEDGSPVALLCKGGCAYDMVDPRNPRPLLVDSSRAKQLSSSAYVFYQPLPDRTIGRADLLSLGVSLARQDLKTIMWMAVAAGFLGLVQPVATGLLISQIVPSGIRSELYDLGGALLACNLASGAFQFTRSIALLRLDGKMDGALQSAVFDRLLRLPAPFFSRFSTGDLANRALGINSIRQAMSGAALSSLLGGLTSVFSLGLLFYYDWQLAIVAMVLVGFYVLTIALVAYLQLRYQRPLLDVRGQISGLLLQLLNGINKLRGAGAESRAFGQWAALFSKEREISFGLGMVSVNNSAFQAAFSVFCSTVMFAFLAWRGYKSLSAGDVVAFFGAFGQFLSAMTSISTAMTSLVAIGPTLSRARPILDEPVEVSDDRPDPEPLQGRLELKGVSFRYKKDGPPSLKNIELVADPGEFIAIVGPSGAGKSTLLRLFLGFEKAETGSILYDGQDVQSVNLQALRRQLGVVLQDTRLMPGSILQNIVGNSLFTLDDAWEAAEIAGIANDIKAMPMGMHTVVTPGATFSGGQMQRLVIARAVVTRPRVLFFDEATSALDNATQEHVSRGLEGLKATRIVIAHRLSTIQHADRIYVLSAETRSFAQVGTYDELIDQPGEFQELARRQMA